MVVFKNEEKLKKFMNNLGKDNMKKLMSRRLDILGPIPCIIIKLRKIIGGKSL